MRVIQSKWVCFEDEVKIEDDVGTSHGKYFFKGNCM